MVPGRVPNPILDIYKRMGGTVNVAAELGLCYHCLYVRNIYQAQVHVQVLNDLKLFLYDF